MPLDMGNPAAVGTASGAKSKADELHMNHTPSLDPEAILDRIRRAHLARLCGLTDHTAAALATIYFAGCAS